MDLTLAQPVWSARQTRGEKGIVNRWTGSTDGEILAEAVRGNSDAFGEIVRRHQVAVFNVAYRLVGDRQVALDLAQDAFVRAYHALQRFDRERPFGPWINRIVANLAVDWLQRRRVPTVELPSYAEDSDGNGGEYALPDVSGEPERLYLEREQRDALRRAILALPVHYRAVVELRHFQDLSYEEIATTLGIPLSDVKSHLFRARRLLRQWLEQYP